MMWTAQFLDWTLAVSMPILLLCVLVGFLRLVRGPHLPDRVVALDLIAVICVGVIALDAIRTDQSYFLRAAIVLGLVAFLGTVGFALYLQRRRR
jgi:multicomponent Na+:H+ antiporter subunit F